MRSLPWGELSVAEKLFCNDALPHWVTHQTNHLATNSLI
jgi:hypothetical protein